VTHNGISGFVPHRDEFGDFEQVVERFFGERGKG
jgi:hypothetical protein